MKLKQQKFEHLSFVIHSKIYYKTNSCDQVYNHWWT